MLSRYFVIVLAAVTAVFCARSRAWAQAVGLAALAIGLTCLRLAETRQLPLLKWVAWGCFALTLIAVGVVYLR